MANIRAKRFCFTLNNYTEEEELCIQHLPDIEFLIYGHERAPSTGTPHLQGFICFTERKYATWIKNNVTSRIHLEVARGSVQDNIQYCSKGDNIFMSGDPPYDQHERGAQAQKRKWDEAKAAAQRGDFDEIPSDLWIKYRRSFEQEYQDMKLDMIDDLDEDLPDHFLWIYGATGTGKSYMARQIASLIEPREKPFLKLVNKWWTGYRGQKVVIIEEMQPDLPPPLVGMLKNWLDRYSFACETKGGQFSSIRPPYIIITSNYHPEEIFPPRDLPAMLRRMTLFEKKAKQTTLQWPRSIYDLENLTFTQSEDEHDEPGSLVRSESTVVLGRRDDAHGNTKKHDRHPPASQEY